MTWKVNTSAGFCPHLIVLPCPLFYWWFFDFHHWTDQVRNSSAAMLKITVQKQKSVRLHWPRDLTGDLFRPPFCDWVMTMSHTWELETLFSLPEKMWGISMQNKKNTKHFPINVTNKHSCTVWKKYSGFQVSCVSVAHKMSKLMKKAMWQSCWTSQQVYRKGRVVKSGWEENIPCGSTASCSAQNKERKWAKCAQLHATDWLYFTSLFLMSRLQTILRVYPVS